MRSFTMARRKRSSKSQVTIDNFREVFLILGLFDLGLLGYDVTWCNCQLNEVVVEERLDRLCADTD